MSPISGGADSASFWGVITGVGATIVGLFAGMVRIGQSIEKIEEKAHKAKELSDKNAENIQNLQLAILRMDALETVVKQILSLFNDEHGNQRIVTTYVCGKKADACNLLVTERIKHMAEMFGERITVLAVKMDELEERFNKKQDDTFHAIMAELQKKR